MGAARSGRCTRCAMHMHDAHAHDAHHMHDAPRSHVCCTCTLVMVLHEGQHAVCGHSLVPCGSHNRALKRDELVPHDLLLVTVTPSVAYDSQESTVRALEHGSTSSRTTSRSDILHACPMMCPLSKGPVLNEYMRSFRWMSTLGCRRVVMRVVEEKL